MADMETEDEVPLGLACALEGFTDANYVKGVLSRLATEDIRVDSNEFDAIYEKFKNTINKYHEQPHLMDKELPAIVEQCLRILDSCPPSSDRFRGTCRLLCLITKTRGYKVVRNLFPHEVADIERVLGFMAVQDPEDSPNWETHYVLLLWLSILAAVPFSLARFDGSGDHQTVTGRFLTTCRTFVGSRLKCNEIAAYLAGCLLSRPDIHGLHMKPYLDWVEAELASDCGPTREFVRVAVMLSVCNIFKVAKREVLQEHLPTALSIALRGANSGQEFERRLALKLLQRIGLCRLSPNLAPWRYLMRRRGLLGRAVASDAPGEAEPGEVPEVIEQIIEALLTGLSDRVLTVRWSAAKGLGRIASRLPENFAAEVVSSVFGFFEEKDRDGLWQGGCMALAELGRRGVLLPAHLATVVQLLLQAFVYEEQRGTYSVGSCVRDTACYLAWTLGRSYEPRVVEPFVEQLAGHLLCVACFDREVNVRRAASAAFQECVGRLGNFPDGIDLVRVADYVSVGKRSRAFLEVGVEVASHKEYTKTLVDHLVRWKVPHWDKSVRDLAATALGRLVALDPSHFIGSVYRALIEGTVSIDAHARLGAVLALGQITAALAKENIAAPEDVRANLLALYGVYEERHYFTSSMHSQTLANFARMISCLARANLNIPTEVFDKWWTVGQRCLENPQAEIRRHGAECLSSLLRFCLEPEEPRCKALVEDCCRQLLGENVERRTGHAHLLSLFHPPLVILHQSLLQETLKAALQTRGPAFVESRKEALISLRSVVCTLIATSPDSPPDLADLLLHIKAAGEDYSLSETFFDVGLHCRLSAMDVFRDLLLFLSREDRTSLLRDASCDSIYRKIVSQIADAHTASAEAATAIVALLVEKCPSLVPCAGELDKALRQENRFDTIAHVLTCDYYRKATLAQLLISMGAKTEKESTGAQLAVLKYLQAIQEDRNALSDFAETLRTVVDLPLFTRNRFLFPPMVRGVGRLLNTGALVNASPAPLLPLMDSVWRSIQRTKDVNRILSSIEIFCEALQFELTAKSSLKRLSILLGHKYFPQVRRQTAQKLYETLLIYSAVVPEENFEVVLALLSNTEWNNDNQSFFGQIRDARNHLCDLVDIPRPLTVAAKG